MSTDPTTETTETEAPQVEPEAAAPEEAAPAADTPVKVSVNDTEVPHAVVQPREPDPDVAPVHETHVKVDEVITDPSDPRAVQVPEAGKGNAFTPIAQAYADGAKTPEDVFAAEAATADDE